jgi:radical SAM protein with 4Fe4S-binding SPASM domain
MAVREPRYEKNRLKFEDHIPFAMPVALHVDVCSACNLRCNFCANHSPHYKGDYNRHYEIMKLDLFKKIIDDLSEFDSELISLRLYNIGEPLLNPRLPEMIKYAKDSKIIKKIDTTTNAVALTHDLSDALVAAGLDFICFSIEAMNNDDYMRITNTQVDINNIIENIIYFFKKKGKCTVHIKSIDTAFNNKAEEEKFYGIFENYCDSIWIDTITNVWPDFESVSQEKNTGKNMYSKDIKPLIVCTQPFYNLSVDPDGKVTHCDLDWKSEFIIGDLLKQSIKEIWDSDIMRKTQILHLEGRRNEIPICAKCPWPENGCIDDFDDHRLEVLKRYK